MTGSSKPSEKSLEVIRTGEGSLYHGNALQPAEVLAAVKVRSDQ